MLEEIKQTTIQDNAIMQDNTATKAVKSANQLGYMTLSNISEWISVEERLPTKEDIKNNQNNCTFFVTVIFGKGGKMQRAVTFMDFRLCDNTWDTCGSDDIITHWMPKTFPEPADVQIINKSQFYDKQYPWTIPYDAPGDIEITFGGTPDPIPCKDGPNDIPSAAPVSLY